MKIAFALLTFSHVPQVARLAMTLSRASPDCIVAIGHSGSESERHTLRAAEGVDIVQPAPGGRARFATLDNLISIMRWLERQPKSYDWLAVMSGQDYPIRPLPELESYLANADADGYFHHFEALDPIAAMAPPMRWDQAEVDNRYHFQYADISPASTFLQRAALKIPRILSECTRNYRLHTAYGIMLGKRATRTPFGPQFKLFGGNAWAMINRKAVLKALEFIDTRPDVVSYFRNVIVPDEAFLPTVLANDPDIKLSSRELRYIDFTGGRLGHPQVFGMDDLARLEDSGCFIARKFDMRQTPEVLDALDKRIGLGAASDRSPMAVRPSVIAAE